MSGLVIRARLIPLLAALLLAAGPVGAGNASIAKAQLPVAKALLGEAKTVVAITHPVVTQVDPHESLTRTQDFTVSGTAAVCWKGDVKPGARISYTVTAEGRPARLSRDHIAFLRSGTGGRWIVVDGPVFDDSPEMRQGLSRLLHGGR